MSAPGDCGLISAQGREAGITNYVQRALPQSILSLDLTFKSLLQHN